jgi:hypothetical protein
VFIEGVYRGDFLRFLRRGNLKNRGRDYYSHRREVSKVYYNQRRGLEN